MAAIVRGFPRHQPTGGETHIDATDVRQARWGRYAFIMLIRSTVLVVIALFGAWAWHADQLAAASTKSTPTAAEVRAADAPVG